MHIHDAINESSCTHKSSIKNRNLIKSSSRAECNYETIRVHSTHVLAESKTSKKVADHCAALIKRHCGLIEFRNNGKRLICTNLQSAASARWMVVFLLTFVVADTFVNSVELSIVAMQEAALCSITEKFFIGKWSMPLSRIENHWSSFCINMTCDVTQDFVSDHPLARNLRCHIGVFYFKNYDSYLNTLCTHFANLANATCKYLNWNSEWIYFFSAPPRPCWQYLCVSKRNPPKCGRAQQSRAANRCN